MVEFTDRLAEGWAFAADHLGLATVPFVAAFLDVSNIARVLAFRGSHVGITFPFPPAIVDLWTFVSAPNPPGAGGSGTFGLGLLLLVVEAALTAGYLGSIAEQLETGGYGFGRNVGQYVVPMLGYAVLVFLFGSGSVLLGLLAGPGGLGGVVVLLFVLVLVFSYLFYATPYLIVLRDDGLIEALRGSYGHAIEGGAYASFGIAFLVTGLVLSVVATAVAVNLGALGILLGATLAAPVGLVLNVATMSFVRDLDGLAGG